MASGYMGRANKDDAYFLGKIEADLIFVIDHSGGLTAEKLADDPILLDSFLLLRIVQIAENGAKLTSAFRNAHPEISWAAIKGMRNLIVHDYGRIKPEIVADTVLNGFPDMLNIIRGLKDK